MLRAEKEKLYIEKMTELQKHWGNPIDNDWDFKDWTDEQLDKGIEDTIGQLQFEKTVAFIKRIFQYLFFIFVILGIIGLLIFGIGQLV